MKQKLTVSFYGGRNQYARGNKHAQITLHTCYIRWVPWVQVKETSSCKFIKKRSKWRAYQVTWRIKKKAIKLGLKQWESGQLCSFTSPQSISVLLLFKKQNREFPGSPVIRTWLFHCRDLGSIPGQGTEIPQEVTRCSSPKERETLESHTQTFHASTYKWHRWHHPRFIGQNESPRTRKITIWWVLLSMPHPSVQLLIAVLSVFSCLGEASEIQLCAEIERDLTLPE